MTEENPTAGDSGASITDRIERMLAADSAPAKPEPTQAQASVETEAEVDPQGDDRQQNQEPQSTISTADVAKYLGVDESMLDVDEDGTIKVLTKIDGKDGHAKFKDLLKDYQLRGHAENESRKAADAMKAVEARRQEVEQQAQAKLKQAEHVVNAAAQELFREYQSIPWDELKIQEPGRWAALRQDYQERNAKLQAALQTIRYQDEQRSQVQVQQRNEFLKAQAQRLPELIPEWKDAEIAKKESGEIRTWAIKNGFTDEEADGISNAHHVAVMRKAMLYDQLQSKKPAIENKVRTAPTLVKPGRSQEVSSKAQTLSNLKHQVQKSGGKRGVSDWLIAAGKV